MKKKIWKTLAIVLVVIQFIPYSIKNEERDPAADLFTVESASPAITSLLKSACYDCHSQEASKPWYAYVAPVKFWVNLHTRGGRQHMDFSKWGTLSAEKRNHKLEECIEMIQDKKMPLNSYAWMHKEAQLSEDQRTQLVAFFNGLK